MTTLHANKTRHSQATRPSGPGVGKKTAFQHVMARASTITAATLLLPVTLVAYSNTTTPPEQSGQSGAADVQMSSEYEIGPDGKLKLPDSRLPAKPNDMGLILGQHTDVSAETFSRYFIETVEYAWNTGDTTLMNKLCSPECQSCQEVISLVNNLYSQDGWVDGTKYLIRQRLGIMDYPMSGYENTKAIAFWITATIGNEYDGQVLDQNSLETQRQWEVHVVPNNKSWLVTSLSVQEMPEEK